MFKKSSFNQPDFADLRLVFRSSQRGTSSRTSNDLATDSPPAKRQCTESSLDAAHFYTNKVILASSSPVIKAMLQKAKEQRRQQAMDAGLSICLVPVECSGSVALLVSPHADQQPIDLQLETLELLIEQEELLACEVLFRAMYSDDLDEEVRCALSSEQGAGVSKVTLLVQVYRLADFFEVCTDQCAQAISALKSADCKSTDVVNSVFSLKRAAPTLYGHSTIQIIIKKCLSYLVARFGRIWELFWWDLQLLKEFKQLDILAVLAFFDSDNLEVTSESEILVLMGAWMGKDWTDRISKDQLVDILNILRLGHLTASFLSNLTAFAPWLPVDPVVLGQAAQWKSCQNKSSERAASMQKQLLSVHGSQVAWFKRKRSRTLRNLLGCFPFSFSKEDLARLLASVQQSGAQGDIQRIRAKTYAATDGYEVFPILTVQIVSDSNKTVFVLSLGLDIKTSRLISKGIHTLVHVQAACQLGKGRVTLGTVDDFVYGTHSWELTRVEALDDLSCLGSYLGDNGELLVKLRIKGFD